MLVDLGPQTLKSVRSKNSICSRACVTQKHIYISVTNGYLCLPASFRPLSFPLPHPLPSLSLFFNAVSCCNHGSPVTFYIVQAHPQLTGPPAPGIKGVSHHAQLFPP